MRGPYFIGIDIGTQGARIVLLSIEGEMIASFEEIFPLDDASREEQSPQVWWDACCGGLKNLSSEIKGKIDPAEIKGIAVTSTSGTVIPLDKKHEPLYPAIMYSDKRSVVEAMWCQETAAKFCPNGYTGFNTSSGLSKMVWYVKKFSQQSNKIFQWCHAADFITGKLSGVWGVTDFTNALKSGYDVQNEEWPGYLFDQFPLKKEWMSKVLPSGEAIGHLDSKVAQMLGLSSTTQVAVGITDGCASQIASGAISPGDWNTTIGTTMVVKGVTEKAIIDPLGRLYSHRHPMGYWMPGGASNTGADWVAQEFGGRLDQCNEKAWSLIPTRHLSYPLRQKGERFPFISADAEGFEPAGLSLEERYVANMEGVAFLERYSFELIRHLSGEPINAVYTAGGASNSEVWLKIRSNVLNLPIYKMKYVSGAVGAAVLAASKIHFNSLEAAGKALIQTEKVIYPDRDLYERYEVNYRLFIDLMINKGYIKERFDA